MMGIKLTDKTMFNLFVKYKYKNITRWKCLNYTVNITKKFWKYRIVKAIVYKIFMKKHMFWLRTFLHMFWDDMFNKVVYSTNEWTSCIYYNKEFLNVILFLKKTKFTFWEVGHIYIRNKMIFYFRHLNRHII